MSREKLSSFNQSNLMEVKAVRTYNKPWCVVPTFRVLESCDTYLQVMFEQSIPYSLLQAYLRRYLGTAVHLTF